MSVSKLPSGRWRAQVHDPRVGHNVSVSRILGGPGTFRTKTEAKTARERARTQLGQAQQERVTVEQWRTRWLTDPLFDRPKESTNIHRRERTKAFAARYGSIPINDVGDFIVTQWLTGGTHNSTIPTLRTMFNDARSAKGGRLVDRNPFAGLGISRGPGNRHKTPPPEQMVWTLAKIARALSGPNFAAWLQVAAFTGMRPGELDALRWSAVDFEAGVIHVSEQWSAGSATFTTPKNGQARDALLTRPARDALLSLPRESDFCFVNLRGGHFTPSSRAYHWKAIRAAAGYDGTLYLATRHFAGAYMTDVLEQSSEDVAIALGHTDGGALVRKLYGHRDTALALGRVRRAYEGAATVTPLRAVRAPAPETAHDTAHGPQSGQHPRGTAPVSPICGGPVPAGLLAV